MFVAVFGKQDQLGHDGRPDRGWTAAESFVTYTSGRCVIRADRHVAVGRRVTTGTDGLVVAFDGRLHNRKELLGRSGLPPRTVMSDAALIGSLYEREGQQIISRLVGEFRCVIYDEREHTFTAAVDSACTRRLWWRDRGDILVTASHMAGLYLAHERLRINEDYLVQRLACGWTSGRSGPLDGASRLLPGELLRASTRAIAIRKYWCPTMFVAAASGVMQEEECVAEFGRLLREGVEQRLPAEGAVLCELSGGLDSTSVTRLAGDVLGGNGGGRLHALTVTYPGAPESDERGLAQLVAQAAGATHHFLDWGASELLFRGMPENAYFWDEPRFNVHSHAMAVAKHQLMQSIGSRVVLSGAGAEVILCSHMEWPVFVADAAIRGRVREVAACLKRWQQAKRVSLPVLLYRSLVGPLLQPVRAMTYEAKQMAPSWLTPRALRRFAQIRAAQHDTVVRRRHTAGAWMAEQWQGAASAADQGYGVYAYETRYPYLHRPLVESVLQMPWDVRVRPDSHKRLLRLVARDLLPAGFATRVSKPADQAVCRALVVQSERILKLVSQSALAELGLVDEHRLTQALEQIKNGFGRGLRFIVTVLAIELWAKSVVSGDWQRMQVQQLRPTLS